MKPIDIPRLRMFAGPNGSGKSTLKSSIETKTPNLWGIYINPDEIEKNIQNSGRLDLSSYGIKASEPELLKFLKESTLLKNANLLEAIPKITFDNNKINFHAIQINSYWASAISDFIRHQLLETGTSFTFETVMSSIDKIEFLKKARAKGFQTYLYYIATEDPSINISRVHNRVTLGGHPVPEEKIISRYKNSLNLLLEAIHYTNRAYVFDNSEVNHTWVAEITDGKTFELKSDQIPTWFKNAVLDKNRAS